MSWTTPKTWVTGEPLTASDLNTHLKDNLNALKTPPTDSYECNEGVNYTTLSTVFVDVDSTNLSLTIVTAGGDVLIGFVGSVLETGGYADKVYLDVTMDGVRIGGDDGLVRVDVQNRADNASFTHLVRSLDAGSHTFNLQWKGVFAPGSSAVIMPAGAGTANADLHPQFWVREV